MLKGGKNGPAIVPGSGQKSLLDPALDRREEADDADGAGSTPSLRDCGSEVLDRSGSCLGHDSTGRYGLEANSGTATACDARRCRGVSKTPSTALRLLTFSNTVRAFHRSWPMLCLRGASYLDLWGLSPTPTQLAQFLNDTQPGKRDRLVDALLSDRRNYSEHWISFWNDLLRNDEGVVYHGERQTITTWLLKALENNLPYDQFVTALLNPEKPEDPRGYLIGVNWRGDVSASQIPPVQAAQNSAQVFMGINLKCASCHDSFINQWKLRDSYGLASFFSEKELELVRCDVKLGEKPKPSFCIPSWEALTRRRHWPCAGPPPPVS